MYSDRYGMKLPHLWYFPEQNPHYLCHILKQEKFKTDIYGKDSKKIDGFGR